MNDTRGPIHIAELSSQLLTAFPDLGPAWQIDYREETGSTNADLRERLDSGAGVQNYSIILADHQTAGQGRLGRAWTAPPRAQLIFSIALTNVDLQRLGTLPLAAGVGVIDGLAQITAVPFRLKWPNDVILPNPQAGSGATGYKNYKKLCGVLGEVTGFGQVPPVPAAIVGIGINHSLTEVEIPVSTGTSLTLEGVEVDRTTLAGAILTAVIRRLKQWETDTFSLGDYRAVCATLGAHVKALLPGDSVITGTAEDVDYAGDLLIRDEQGTVHTVSAGDVEHLR